MNTSSCSLHTKYRLEKAMKSACLLQGMPNSLAGQRPYNKLPVYLAGAAEPGCPLPGQQGVARESSGNRHRRGLPLRAGCSAGTAGDRPRDCTVLGI